MSSLGAQQEVMGQRASKKGSYKVAPSSTYPKNRENSDHGLSFPSPDTQTIWSEFLLSLVNTESGVVWVLVRVFLGPWSEFPPARSETLG